MLSCGERVVPESREVCFNLWGARVGERLEEHAVVEVKIQRGPYAKARAGAPHG